jgi:hypothetical protein
MRRKIKIDCSNYEVISFLSYSHKFFNKKCHVWEDSELLLYDDTPWLKCDRMTMYLLLSS